MKTTKRLIQGVGKVMLALTVAISMPVLIWVALGAAIHQRTSGNKPRNVQMLKDILAAR